MGTDQHDSFMGWWRELMERLGIITPSLRSALRLRVSSRYTVECFDRLGRLKWRAGFSNLVVTEGLNMLLDRSFGALPADVNAYVGLIGAHTGTVSITSGAAAVTGSGTSFTNADNGSDLIIVGAGASGADLITTVSGNPSSGTALTAAANAGATVSGAAYALEPRPADVMNSKSFNESAPYSNSNRPTWTKNGAAAGGAMSNSSAKASFTINATGRIFGAFMSTNNTKSGTTGILYGGGLFTTGGSRAVQSGDTVNVQVDLSVTAG